jgi:hypothetical protein
MPFFEAAKFCSTYEYNRHIDTRLDLASTNDDELLMLMILLDGIHEAAKLPARLIKKTTPKGLLHVEIAFLDDKLNTRHTEIFAAQDDFIIVKDELEVTFKDERSAAVECYGRDYFEDQMPPEFFESQVKKAEKVLLLT